jgi:hypothetical protein
MARGLSDLQKWIIREVEAHGYITTQDIHTRYFRWQKGIHRGSNWAKAFSPNVDPKDYNRVNATISRSMHRLVRRGLVVKGVGNGFWKSQAIG